MKNKLYLFLTIVVVTLLFTSCDENKIEKNELQKKETSSPTLVPIIDAKPTKEPSQKYTLNFMSIDKEPTILEIKNGIYNFSNILQPIVLVNFFSTWCPPCRGEIPHLNNLQKKYKSSLFIMGLLIHDDIEEKEIKCSIALRDVNYYISNSKESNNKLASILSSRLKLQADFELPMMVMFVYGEYYRHYEGIVPEEMIESDIKQALEDI